jgi:hypothetical protein
MAHMIYSSIIAADITVPINEISTILQRLTGPQLGLFLMIPPPRPVRRTTASDSISMAYRIHSLISFFGTTIVGVETVATTQWNSRL